ncbi:antitoxin MazE [Paenibacillus sp. LBL]|uniref:AbrB/MazE/SpoVT family DNA-binding domain-containing protein n=1 Tax=Paenibacillus sp. LBL TaxID=2940563 RepID=UPI00247467B0|nr:AbrB/MazE/SpoVT family DNA-binding domain-containing protein [Paenibacillus sp. LBL]MDH6674376.1 antitoxin MazE [Paenibacillus sp. LBL]
MSKKKIVKIGNSLGVIIPSNIIEEKGLNAGDPLMVTIDENGDIILKPVKEELPEGIRAEVLDKALSMMDKYKDTLKGLQDR